MDNLTIETYNREAESIARLHSTLTPYRIYELVEQYFVKGGTTADIGCGIGRDTHWLNQHGFPAIGIDASEEMLNQARCLYSSNRFIQDCLPDLNQIGDSQFQNILCSAVLMHLSSIDIKNACYRLLQLLNKNGRLIVSFRGTNEVDNREKGKLYEQIDIEDFLIFFTKNECEILIKESETEIKRNLTWYNFVIKK